MKSWTIAIFLECYCTVFVGGQVQTSLKGTRSGKIFPNNSNPLLGSTLQEIEDDKSLVQQSFAEIAKDETRRLAAPQNIITTWAGTGALGYSGDRYSVTYSTLSSPAGLMLDVSGNVYISDTGNGNIRYVIFNGPTHLVYVLGLVGMYPWGAIGGNQKAKWVWSDSGAASSSNTDPWTFSESFLSTSSYTGIIEVCVDDRGTVYFNSQLVNTLINGQSISSFGYCSSTGIQQAYINVIAGTNSIVVNAQNTGGAAGLLLSIKDNTGNYVYQTGSGSMIFQRTPGNILTLAGTGQNGAGGYYTVNQLNYPTVTVIDSSSNYYIADRDNQRIRLLSSLGAYSNVAGSTGTPGSTGDGGAASSALLHSPEGLLLVPNVGLYIADSANHKIRLVANGIITTIAGTGVAGTSGDGGAATSAQLNYPNGLAMDLSGNIYISDYYNNKIRVISAGILKTFAGTGSAGSSGDGGKASSAQLYLPIRMNIDTSGNMYIPDSGNNKIRLVNSAGIITTFAGTGTAGNGGDGGVATSAQFNNPQAVATDISGNVYIADSTNNVIRLVIKQPAAPTSTPTLSPTSPPTISPTASPSTLPTMPPTAKPVIVAPTYQPSSRPTSMPSMNSYGVYGTLVATYNFETVLTTSTFTYIQTNGGSATIAGWTVVITPDVFGSANQNVGIVSYQNNIGFPSPFPNRHHYICWFQNSLSTLSTSSITRSLTNAIVGGSYSISFWYVCRNVYGCQKDFTVKMDDITVYSTPPTSFSWKTVILPNCHIATSTSMTLTFQSSNTGQFGVDTNMGIDQISVWVGTAISVPTRAPSTATPSYTPTSATATPSYTPTSAAPSSAAPTYQPSSRPTRTPTINAQSLAPIPVSKQLPTTSISIVQMLNVDYTTVVAPKITLYIHNFRLAVSECLKLEISSISAVSFGVTGNIRRSLLAGTTTARYTVTMTSSNRNAIQTAVTQVSSTGGTLSTVLSQKMGQTITLAAPVFITDAPTSHPSSGPTSQPTQPTGQPTSTPSCGAGHHGNGHGHGCGICDAGSIPSYLGSDVCMACPVNTYQPLPGSAHCLTCPYPLMNFASGQTNCQGFCACLYGTPIAIVMTVLLVVFIGGLAPAGQQGYVILAVVFFPSLDFFSDVAYLMTNGFYDTTIFVIGWLFVLPPIPIFIRTVLIKRGALLPRFVPVRFKDVMFLRCEGYADDRFYFPGYRSKHDGQIRPLFPFLSQDEHSQIHLVLMEALAWILAISLQLFVIPVWFFGTFFYITMFLPFWLAMGCVFHATKVIAVGAVWNLWFKVWTRSDKHNTDIEVDTLQLNTCLFHEFFYESLPQLIIQVINNQLTGQWSVLGIFSIVQTIYCSLNGVWKFYFYRYCLRNSIDMKDIPVEFDLSWLRKGWVLKVEPKSKDLDQKNVVDVFSRTSINGTVYCDGDGGIKSPNPSQIDISRAGGGGGGDGGGGYNIASAPPLVHQDSDDHQGLTPIVVILDKATVERNEREIKERACVICTERQRDIVMYPCRHVCICSVCRDAHPLRDCPVCRTFIESSEKIFLP